MNKLALITGCVFCGLSVALGAFGTHLIADRVTPDRLDTWEIGARYLMTHGLALCFIGILAFVMKFQFKLQTWLLLLGTSIFSFSLFTLVIFDLPALGMVTPIGGVLTISGWCALIVGIIKRT
jgi:uncharacterized membrane protein YgdD (TMEM256/DUF423 family)